MTAMNLKFQTLLTFILLGIQTTLGAVFFKSAGDLPSNTTYDFIVAGGGTGGSLVATRLAQNPDWKVLVVEAGASNEEYWMTTVPGTWQLLHKTPMDWNYTTIPQVGLNNRELAYSRAKTLGGCSSHNALIYTRGAKGDWDRYAQVAGNDDLKWDSILPRLEKAEKWHAEEDLTGHYDPEFHGTDGQLFVSAPYSDHPFNAMLVESGEQLPDEFPFNLDWNDGDPRGTAWNHATISPNSTRSSAATDFLGRTGSNVHVLVNSQVTRILPVGNANKKDFRTVELAADVASSKTRITARKEVILGGGIFGSPQILMNSGIGKKDELEAVGVKVLVDNHSVGKNLSDHVAVMTQFSSTLPTTNYVLEDALNQWNTTRDGPLAQSFQLNHMSFIRLPDDAPPFKDEGYPDPSPGPGSPQIEFTFAQVNEPDATTGSTNTSLVVYVVNLHPVARGSVNLTSSDPFAYPTIDPAHLASPMDMSILREAVRSIRRLLSAPTFSDSVFENTMPPANITSDEDLEVFLRANGQTWLHGVGSASMSPKGAKWGVVDPDFRVKGTKGLRIVDASVIPLLPSAHTQAPVYGFAEVASELIARTWSSRN